MFGIARSNGLLELHTILAYHEPGGYRMGEGGGGGGVGTLL